MRSRDDVPARVNGKVIPAMRKDIDDSHARARFVVPRQVATPLRYMRDAMPSTLVRCHAFGRSARYVTRPNAILSLWAMFRMSRCVHTSEEKQRSDCYVDGRTHGLGHRRVSSHHFPQLSVSEREHARLVTPKPKPGSHRDIYVHAQIRR